MLKSISRKLSHRAAIFISFMVVLLAPFAVVASSSAAAGPCGQACTGKATSYVPAGHAVACSNDGRIIASGHPTAANGETTGFNDNYMNVVVYYSPSCETMWEKVSNLRAIGRASCNLFFDRWVSPGQTQFEKPCPSAGTTIVSVMIDDHSPTHGTAASVELDESMPSGAEARFYKEY